MTPHPMTLTAHDVAHRIYEDRAGYTSDADAVYAGFLTLRDILARAGYRHGDEEEPALTIVVETELAYREWAEHFFNADHLVGGW